LRGHLTSILLCLLQVAAGLSLTATLSRMLDITEYGFYVTFISTALILAVLTQSGMPDIIMRETAARRSDRRAELRSLWRGGDIVILPTLTICSIIGLIALRVTQGELPDIGLLALMGLHLPLMAFLAMRAGALKGLGAPNVAHALIQILPPIASIVVILCAHQAGIPITLSQAVLAYALGLVSALTLSHVIRQRFAPDDDGTWAGRAEQRAMRRASLPVAGVSGIAAFSAQVDVLMLGVISGAAAAGIYQVAISCAMLISILDQRVGMVVAHRIPDLWRERNTAEIEAITRPVALIVSSGAALILAISAVSGGPILASVFGEEFRASAQVLIIVSLSLLISGLFGSVRYVLLMTGNQKAILRCSITSALLNICLNPPLIYLAGPVGAALAYMISMAVLSRSMWVKSRKLGIDPSVMGWLQGRRNSTGRVRH
jgi:O-antigen/teichoic acid export membrane protein